MKLGKGGKRSNVGVNKIKPEVTKAFILCRRCLHQLKFCLKVNMGEMCKQCYRKEILNQVKIFDNFSSGEITVFRDGIVKLL